MTIQHNNEKKSIYSGERVREKIIKHIILNRNGAETDEKCFFFREMNKYRALQQCSIFQLTDI